MPRPKRIITKQEIKEICRSYKSGKTINNLQKETKLQKCKIKEILNSGGIKTLTAYQTKIKNAKTINLNCLDATTPLSAYVLGLIFADGHVNYDENKYKYYVSLISVDYDIVSSAQTLFGEHFPIQTIFPKNNKKKKITYNIVVNSKEFALQLRKQYNLLNQKSFNLPWPKLNNDMYSFFISGLLSTDGCIRTDIRRKEQMCGLEFSYSSNCLEFIQNLRQHLSTVLEVPGKGHIKIIPINKKRKNPNYTLRYTGANANKILHYIYNNTDSLTRCKRKYDIFQNYLTCVSNSMI